MMAPLPMPYATVKDKKKAPITIRDVNEAGRVHIVTPSYPTRSINIRLVPIPTSVKYPLCGYPLNF